MQVVCMVLAKLHECMYLLDHARTLHDLYNSHIYVYSVLYSVTEQDPVKNRPTCNWVYIIYQYLCEKVLYGVCTYSMIPWVTKHTNTF